MDSFRPLVRFAGFEGEWEIERFGDIIEECFDKSTIENEDTLLSSSISGMYLNSELFGHQRGQSNIGYRKVRKNMLVLSAQNLHLGNANVNLRFDHGLVSPAYKIYDIIGANPEFMAHWIKREQTKDFFLNATTEGASLCRKNIIWEDLYDQYLSLPSLPEQQKISEYFTEIDRAISLQTEKLSKLKQIKAASLQNMFPHEGQMLPKVRFAGFEGEWERVRLGELFERSSEKNDLTFGTDKIISVANMYFLKNERNVQDDYLRTYNVMRLGDIAFEGHKSKNFAHGRFVENTIGDGIVSHVFVVLKRANGDYDLNFWKYYINDENVMGSILTRSTKSSTMMNDIVVDDFLKESILVPSYEEQKVIGAFLTKLDRKIELETQKLEKLKQIKSACLSKMFV